MRFIGNGLKPLAKIVLIPLGLMTVASATDAAIHQKMFRSGFTTPIISNEEMNDIMKIVKSLEESALLIKSIVKQLNIASLLGNLLTGKATTRSGEGKIKAGAKF